MNVALPDVVAAAVDGVEGAVADGVLVELGVVEGDVDCASALVNARPLTAATAMMFLSMYASWASLLKTVGGRQRKLASLKGQRGNRDGVPDVFQTQDRVTRASRRETPAFSRRTRW